MSLFLTFFLLWTVPGAPPPKPCLHGILDLNGKVVVSPKYESPLIPVGSDFFLFKKGNRVGVLDRKGAVVLKPHYHSLHFLMENQTCNPDGTCRVDSRFVNPVSDFFDPCLLPHCRIASTYLIAHKTPTHQGSQGGKGTAGLITLTGKTIIDFSYEHFWYFNGKSIFATVDYQKWRGFDLTKGTWSDRILDQLGRLNENLILAGTGGKTGFIDRDGQTVIDFQFDSASPFRSGVAVVEVRGKFGVIDPAGRFLVQPSLLSLTMDDHGFLKFTQEPCQNGKCKFGLMDTRGKVILKPEYLEILKELDGGLIRVVRDGACKGGRCAAPQTGYFDTQGRLVIPFRYHMHSFFRHGALRVANHVNAGIPNSKQIVGFVDQKGHLISPLQWSEATDFNSDGLAVVVRGSKCGYINLKGQVLGRLEYDECDHSTFPNGTMRVRKGSKWGLLKSSGTLFMKVQYDDIYFSDGYGWFEQGGRQSVFDVTGKVIIASKYTSIQHLTGDYFLANAGAACPDMKKGCRGADFGIIDRTGKVVVPFGNAQFQNYTMHNLFFLRSGCTYPPLPKNPPDEDDDDYVPPVVCSGGKLGFLSTLGPHYSGQKYDSIQPVFRTDNLIFNTVKGLVGLIDIGGNEVLSPTYTRMTFVYPGFFQVEQCDGSKLPGTIR